MRLFEISKPAFKKKLQYPWMEELLDKFHRFKNGWAAENQWNAEFYTDQDPMILRLYRYGGNTTEKTARIMAHQLMFNTIITEYFDELSISEHETIHRSQSKYPEMSWKVEPKDKVNEDKIDFKRKLKYPMELVNGITKEIENVNEQFDQDWIKVDYDQEFGDDFVAWTIELTYEPTIGKSTVFGDTIESVYKAIVRNYQWEDVSLSYHILNREDHVDGASGYLLMGIQLDV